ncbi:hypothetical protein HJG60_011701 [Phyllostomus discolor]|uniref:Uncharacterized protein n=1 Tax=Phyllostomus discolor TaxID=89673 RepID=A0A834DXK9_9CHIR|nr:hypothetical protein HJG60_011701 [Phyllostomus discolor]
MKILLNGVPLLLGKCADRKHKVELDYNSPLFGALGGGASVTGSCSPVPAALRGAVGLMNSEGDASTCCRDQRVTDHLPFPSSTTVWCSRQGLSALAAPVQRADDRDRSRVDREHERQLNLLVGH